MGGMSDLFGGEARLVLALAAALVAVSLAAFATRRRGGRFRGLPGWVGLWWTMAAVLVLLSRSDRRIAFPLLAFMMFAALRAYFSVAPVRPRDRYAILVSYLSIPLILWPAYTGATTLFLAVVPVVLFLVVPVFLVYGTTERGLLGSMGRMLIGVIFFVFCIGHLALFAGPEHHGLLELFGVLVLASELPQRLAGRPHPKTPWARPLAGIFVGMAFATVLGYALAPMAGLAADHGARVGWLVSVAATLGALVSEAVATDLGLTVSAAVIGRGATMTRMVPAVYAAPVFFHYITYFSL
jgi:predicted CDP-diglyceride synthetase/phosphatidate cytidylyltransferase